jgi:hypothetical protein
MIASTPCASSHNASSTVVADDKTLEPIAFTRPSNSADGKPKWKLTTAGLNSLRTSAASALKGERPGPAGMLAASIPYFS